METGGGDGSKTGLVMKKKGNKNRQPVSVPASPRTTGKSGEQQHNDHYYIFLSKFLNQTTTILLT